MKNLNVLNEIIEDLKENGFEYNDYVELCKVIEYYPDQQHFSIEQIIISEYYNTGEVSNSIFTVEKALISEVKCEVNDNTVNIYKLENSYFKESQNELDKEIIAIFHKENEALQYAQNILQADTLEYELNRKGFQIERGF